MARLNLQSSADGAGGDVTIDGVPRGTDPEHVRADRRAPPGRGAQGRPQAVLGLGRPAGGRAAHPRRQRWRAPRRRPARCWSTRTTGGDVYVDGQRKDAAPAIISGLPAGDHVVEVKKDGFPPWRQTVNVPAGQQVKVAATFGAATQLEPAHHLERARRRDVRRRRIEGQGAGHRSRRSSRASTSSAAGRRASSRWSRRSASRRARTRSSASAWRWRRPTGRARR